MKIAVVALTRGGKRLAYRLEEELEEEEVYLYLPNKLNPRKDVAKFNSSLKDLVGQLFQEYDGIIFIMALGIVVRVITPYLVDKRNDPAIVTLDETGQNVISTLSGHLGGANDLTEKVANLLGANPVITTATDCQGKLAFDLLAQKLNCEIVPFANLKLANAAVVNQKQVNIFTNLELDLKLAENIKVFPLNEINKQEGFPVIISNQNLKLGKPYLQLVPKNIIIGIGCRKGIKSQQIEEAVQSALDQLSLKKESIKMLATVDLKQDETGILEFADKLDLPLKIITRREIKDCDFDYTSSDFVKKMIGVGGVCEPVAILSAKNPELILPKRSKNKVTIAVVKENYI